MTTIKPQAATHANVAASVSSVALFAAAGTVHGRTVWNDSTAVLYLKFGGAASATSCTVKIPADGYYEFPAPVYGGPVEGVWAAATGTARTTQW